MQFLWQLQRQLLSSISTSRIQVASNFKNIQKWRQYGINPLKQLKWKKNTQNTDKNISSQTLIVNQSFWYTCIYAIMYVICIYVYKIDIMYTKPWPLLFQSSQTSNQTEPQWHTFPAPQEATPRCSRAVSARNSVKLDAKTDVAPKVTEPLGVVLKAGK